MATVVTKLNIVNLISPILAKGCATSDNYKKLVCDLNIPVKIKVMPIIREKDGLAMSSRNVYLNQQERKDALVLSSVLNLAKDLLKKVKGMPQIINSMKRLSTKEVSKN